MAWAEDHVIVDPAIFAQRDFVFGAAIEVIEHGPWQAPLGKGAKVGDRDSARRCDGACRFCHDPDRRLR
jgi:hypothetical protein